MAQTTTATTNFNQTVVALVEKRLEELLRAPLPHSNPANFRTANFVKGTNNTLRFINIPDLSVVAGTPTPGTPPWLTEAVTPTPQSLAFGYEEFSANQAGQFVQLSDVAITENPYDLLREAADRVARQAIAVADKRIAEVLITGTNVLYAGSASSSATLNPADKLTGQLVKLAVAKMKAGLIPTFGDGTYHAIVQPGAVYDLQTDTAVGGWIDANRYAGATALMTGEIGQYAGVRFMESAVAGQKLATVGPVIPGAGAAIIAATDTFTSTNPHNLVTNNRVKLVSVTGAAGLVAGTTYYVIVTGANTFKFAATFNGAAIDVTTDSSAQSVSSVADINSTHIFGPESYAFGAWDSIQTYFTAPGGPGDELHQRASVGWKGFFGAVIMGQGANASNVTAPRYLRVESANQIS